MSEQDRNWWRAALLLAGATCSPQLQATPSGLNNIPTADTAGEGDYVFQAFTNFGEQRRPDNNIGFKTGLGQQARGRQHGGDSEIQLHLLSRVFGKHPAPAGPRKARRNEQIRLVPE